MSRKSRVRTSPGLFFLTDCSRLDHLQPAVLQPAEVVTGKRLSL